MRSKSIVAIVCAVLLLVNGSVMLGQEKEKPKPRSQTNSVFVTSEGPQIEVRGEGHGGVAWAVAGHHGEIAFAQEAHERAAFEFGISEMVLGKPVKSAPYSAEAVTESIHTLADGNRIVRRNSATISRDGEGRTRRDQTLSWMGKESPNAEAIRTSFINDPVAGVSYTLHHNDKTAFKVAARKIRFEPSKEGDEKAKAEMKAGETKARAEAEAHDHIKIRPVKPPRMPAGPEGHFEAMFIGDNITINFDGHGPFGPKDAKKESLGTQAFDGVQAEGVRVTMTIPAGAIGNEREIHVVSERWYSPELQVVVMSRHSDPRMGETTYKLTNINRSEPSRSLFEVPSDYTLKEEPQFREMRKKIRRDEEK